MSAKHTPAPWLIDDDDGDLSIYVPSEHGLRYVIARDIGGEVFKDANGKFTDYSRVDANARLIAAAPELLEALEQAVTSMQDSGYQNGHPAVRAARAAIAKATGTTP